MGRQKNRQNARKRKNKKKAFKSTNRSNMRSIASSHDETHTAHTKWVEKDYDVQFHVPRPVYKVPDNLFSNNVDEGPISQPLTRLEYMDLNLKMTLGFLWTRFILPRELVVICYQYYC